MTGTTGTAIPQRASAAGARSVRRAGGACIAGAAIQAVSGVVTQVVAASTDVSDEVWSYPWTGSAFTTVSLIWGAGQVLLLIGVLGLRRSGATGPTGAARAGLTAAVIGTALILVGQLASIPVADDFLDDTGPQLLGGVFGLGSVLTAVGMVLAGIAALQTGRWTGWRRYTVLAVGAATVALVGLQFTPALSLGVAIYALAFFAVGVALLTDAADQVRASVPAGGAAAATSR